MRLLLLWGWIVIPGYEALVGPKEVSGPEGSSLSVQCSYEDKHEDKKKYWCRDKGIIFSLCDTFIITEAGKEETDGKVSIKDNPENRTFTVIMREVTLKDAGKYQCGISLIGFDEIFAVTVVVSSGLGSSVSPNSSLQPLSTRSVQQGAKVWETQSPELRLGSSVSPNPSLQPLSTRSVRQVAKVWETQSPELKLGSSVSSHLALQPLSTRSVQQGAKVHPRVNTRAEIRQRGQETLQTRTQQDTAQAVTSHHSSSDMNPRSRPFIPLIEFWLRASSSCCYWW
ncbi:CMRF35-like molecule 9 isoform X1 [Phascolarctos cinereus]|uniref:CMRF35-like molecule 9 isoform X1 n=1 Tax=Phascolarctos cinereus TaxID=38626 RepID=A0A6P5JB52_PHACI|nr:CMRF35-like molecule 9 isoform X1 [Phascolarctos cinereus]